VPHINFFRRLFPFRWLDGEGDTQKSHYFRLWLYTCSLTALVSIAPLVIMSAISYYQYKKAFREELVRPIHRLTSSVKRSTEFFLEERRAAMEFINRDKSFAELADQEQLARIFRNMKEAFGGFVDLGLIDSAGVQRAYAGPYQLRGVNYRDQDWFHEVRLRDVYLSDVFMGYRNFPHFVIAVKHEGVMGDFYVLRATIDVQFLDRQIQTLELQPSSDVFIINHQGILQTPSRLGKKALEESGVSVPPYSEGAEVIEERDEAGNARIIGYAYIEQSPFIFMLIKNPDALMKNWAALRNRLVAFLAISAVVILLLILGTSSYMVHRLREADQRQAEAYHHLEYSNKMATIGRLGAGVAHEINNPLAIINEKTGLLKDLLLLEKNVPQKEKLITLVDSVLNSVERCSRITHRLLGFAKHIDVRREPIDVNSLITEVLDFLSKEAVFRDITTSISVRPDFPTIESDRGQLQQVFLNIINNAFAAMEDRGQLLITLQEKIAGGIEVTISDTGPGIPEDVRARIFEPFFSTKKGHGTGLGLSITYGIVEKLGGHIDVISEVGHGTSFIITLPLVAP